MKVVDVIFALICGRVVGFLVGDFLAEWGISIGPWQTLILWVAFPFLALASLWIAYEIFYKVGQKALFVYQAAKHILVGGFATVVDLKAFEMFFWFFSLAFTANPLVSKAISFVISTAIKYVGNKFWTFQRHEKEHIHREIGKFIFVICIGLIIDVTAFHYISFSMGPQFGLENSLWIKISVVAAAIIAAVWNFLGEKFLVFKK